MELPSRESILDCLDTQWGTYVTRFQGFSTSEQNIFLEKQGYKRLQDLLAHVTAWWQDGMEKINKFLQDSGYEPSPVDVDAFNAAAVEGVKNQSEVEVIAAFETTRLQFVELVQNLSDEDLASPNIIRQLIMEVTGHYEDHQITE